MVLSFHSLPTKSLPFINIYFFGCAMSLMSGYAFNALLKHAFIDFSKNRVKLYTYTQNKIHNYNEFVPISQ